MLKKKTFTEIYNNYIYNFKKEVVKSIEKSVSDIVKIYKKMSINNECATIVEYEENKYFINCTECDIDITLDAELYESGQLYKIEHLYQDKIYDKNEGHLKWGEIKLSGLIKLADYLNVFKTNIKKNGR